MEDQTELKADIARILSYIETDQKTGRKGMFEMCENLEKRVEELEQWKREMMIKIGLVALIMTGIWTLLISCWKPITAWIVKHLMPGG